MVIIFYYGWKKQANCSVQRKWCPIACGWWILFITCPIGKWFFGRIQITEELQSILLINFFLRLVEMTFRLVHARYSLPEWHPVWDWVGMWNHMFFCWCRQMYRLISVAFLVSCGRVSDNSWLSLAESATTVFRSVNLRSLLCLSILLTVHQYIIDTWSK